MWLADLVVKKVAHASYSVAGMLARRLPDWFGQDYETKNQKVIPLTYRIINSSHGSFSLGVSEPCLTSAFA